MLVSLIRFVRRAQWRFGIRREKKLRYRKKADHPVYKQVIKIVKETKANRMISRLNLRIRLS
jgi:hypothetical protein